MTHWLSKLEVLGLISQVQVLKVKVPDVGFKTFVHQGEAQGFESPPDCVSLYQGCGFW